MSDSYDLFYCCFFSEIVFQIIKVVNFLDMFEFLNGHS